MLNSESGISSGKADTTDFTSAQSNSSTAAVNKTEKCSEDETFSEFLSKEHQTQNGVKTRSYASRTNNPIDKFHKVFNSSHPSHSETSSTSVVESIEYTVHLIVTALTYQWSNP